LRQASICFLALSEEPVAAVCSAAVRSTVWRTGLRLEEGPEVRGLDVVRERRGLRVLAERFREGEHQRQHRDQQCDALVAAVVGVAVAV
jgi:hypothetical protein